MRSHDAYMTLRKLIMMSVLTQPARSFFAHFLAQLQLTKLCYCVHQCRAAHINGIAYNMYYSVLARTVTHICTTVCSRT